MNTQTIKTYAFVLSSLWAAVGHQSLLAQTALDQPQEALSQPQQGDEQQTTDPIGKHLFAPELVLQYAEQIELEDSQKEEIESAVESAREKMPSLREGLNVELESLGGLLEEGSSDNQAIQGQLDKVLKEERKVKQLHLKLLLFIRDELTTEQQSTLQDLKSRIIAARELQSRLNAKLQRVQQGMKKYALLGSPPAEITQKLQQFQQMAQEGKVEEAEQLIDQVLEQIESDQ